MKPLCALLSLCVLCVLSPGCTTPPPPPRPVLIIGERVLAPDPNTDVHLGPLIPPARQWYIVDDIGLGLWLNIAPPASQIDNAVQIDQVLAL